MSKVSRDAAIPITEKTRYHASRREADRARKLTLRHAKHVGEVIHAWNRAHASCFALFMRVGFAGDYAVAIDLWHTVHNDKGQRAMLEVVVRRRLRRGLFQSGILWAIDALNTLSSFRNDAAHAEMIWYYDQLVPGLATRPTSRARLTDTPLARNWRTLRGDLIAIESYLVFLEMALTMGLPRPLSRRPRLQLARKASARTQERSRRAKTKARERQQQA